MASAIWRQGNMAAGCALWNGPQYGSIYVILSQHYGGVILYEFIHEKVTSHLTIMV